MRRRAVTRKQLVYAMKRLMKLQFQSQVRPPESMIFLWRHALVCFIPLSPQRFADYSSPLQESRDSFYPVRATSSQVLLSVTLLQLHAWISRSFLKFKANKVTPSAVTKRRHCIFGRFIALFIYFALSWPTAIQVPANEPLLRKPYCTSYRNESVNIDPPVCFTGRVISDRWTR